MNEYRANTKELCANIKERKELFIQDDELMEADPATRFIRKIGKIIFEEDEQC